MQFFATGPMASVWYTSKTNEDLVLWTWCNMLLAFVLQEEEKIVQRTPTSLDKKTVNEDQKRVL